MVQRSWGIAALLLMASLSLWLLMAGPERLLGVDTGMAGVALLVTVAWVSLYGVSRLPRGTLERAASPGEWKAWIGSGFMLAAIVYFLGNVDAFADGTAWNNPEAAAVGRHLVLLLVAWAVLSSVLSSRWKSAVEEDERDREIAAKASGWGRGALTVCVIGIAVMLAFSPARKLQWAAPSMVANLLVFALMWGWFVEYVATGVAYWRDRR